MRSSDVGDLDFCGAAVTADLRSMSIIGGLVKLNAEPRRKPANLGADRAGMFADSGGENLAIQAAERRCE